MRISYEDIVADYEKGIQTKLRGFRPSEEFLDTWVHDEDPALSILNMVEAAQLGGVDALEVVLGPKTAGRLDRARLEKLAGAIGRASLTPEGQGLLLKVSYGA